MNPDVRSGLPTSDQYTTPTGIIAINSGKGTIRFKPDDPPPANLVRIIVKAQIASLVAN